LAAVLVYPLIVRLMRTYRPVILIKRKFDDDLKLLKCPIEDNKVLTTASYLLVRANYKTIKSVFCFDDSLIFARCIIFCNLWLPGFQSPTC